MDARLRKTLSDEQLARYVARQLNGLFDDGRPVEAGDVAALLPTTLARVEYCFSHVDNRYFFDGKSVFFDHLHGDQYAMFLYLLANTAYKEKAPDGVAAKTFLLNKSLHGVDAYYEVELPSIFLFVHPLATVLGRGRYADYLVVYQRCGIGSNHGVYPTLETHVTLHPGSAVLGSSTVGSGSSVAAESLVLDQDLPPGSLYIGNPRDHIIRSNPSENPIWRK